MIKYSLLLFAMILDGFSSKGQSSDSTIYYQLISDTSISNLKYSTGYYKNGVLKFEGWTYEKDEWPFHFVRGLFKAYNSNGTLNLEAFFPLVQSDSIEVKIYNRKGKLVVQQKTSYENYVTQKKVEMYDVVVDAVRFKGWSRVMYRSNGNRYNWGSCNEKGRQIGNWFWYDKAGNLKKITYYTDSGKLYRKEKYEQGELVKVDEKNKK